MKKIIVVLLKKLLPLVSAVCMFSGCVELIEGTVEVVKGVGEAVGEIGGAIAEAAEAEAAYASYQANPNNALYGMVRVSKGVYTIKLNASHSKIKNNEKARDDVINSFVNVLAQERGYESYDIEMKTVQMEKKPKQISHWEYTITMPGAIPVIENSKITNKIDDIALEAVTDTAFASNASGIYYRNNIAWGNNMFVYVAEGIERKSYNTREYRITYSQDGITWTAVTDKIFEKKGIRAIAYGNDKFVAVGAFGGGKILYSSDSVNWTEVKNTTFGKKGIQSVAYGNGKFVIGGYDGKMAYSLDGITWTAIKTTRFGGGDYVEKITYGNDKFVAVSTNYKSGSKMAYSQDGVNWTAVKNTTFKKEYIEAIAYGNGKFVIGGYDGKMATSSDGITWTAVTPTLSGSICAMTYGNGIFVAGYYYGGIAYSQDGITWTGIADSTIKAKINAIAYGNGKFIAVSEDNKMAYWDGNTE